MKKTAAIITAKSGRSSLKEKNRAVQKTILCFRGAGENPSGLPAHLSRFSFPIGSKSFLDHGIV